jgi:hypothetical protein
MNGNRKQDDPHEIATLNKTGRNRELLWQKDVVPQAGRNEI